MELIESAPFKIERLGIVMRPDPNIPEEVEGVLNPGAARGPDGNLYLFPRIVGEGNFSRIGIAKVIFDENGDKPIGVERLGYALEPTEPYELRPEEGTGGCEDPRVTYIEAIDTYVMAYAAWGPSGPRIAVAISKDCLNWQRLGLITYAGDEVLGVDFNAYDNKDGVFGPNVFERSDGVLCIGLMHRPAYTTVETAPHGTKKALPSIWISYCDAEAVEKGIEAITHVGGHRLGIDPEDEWEQLRIGAGTPPVRTHLGMMMIYHGVAGHLATLPGERNVVNYTAGLVFFEPGRQGGLKYRTHTPIFVPETPDETQGVVNNVVFPTGVDDRGNGVVDFYYGMADKYIGAARLTLPDALPEYVATEITVIE
jgi:beta-1,2-mannobiose phosphorylase / 1,2-beta-oligomannan phosphorylase